MQRSHSPVPSRIRLLVFAAAVSVAAGHAQAGESPVFKISNATERMEMISGTSRVVLSQVRIKRVSVGKPELVEVTALSPTEVQLLAKSAGVTPVNFWDEEDQIYTIDVIVNDDAQHLTMLLQQRFPKASLRVVPIQQAAWISGYVDRPEDVAQIVAIAEEFYPKVINAIQVGGVRQVLLKVQVMEVQRSKLRKLGFNFVNLNGDDFVASSVGELIRASTIPVTAGTISLDSVSPPTATFGVLTNNNAFFGFLEALRRDELLKILADPNLVAISGRPASLLSGGEFPILVPQGLGTNSIIFKQFGVQLEFVPIVLGNGRIRLEVRPEVSERDFSSAIEISGITVPGLKTRRVDTAVEMNAGQTLAIGGLINQRVEAENNKIPVIGELPWVGAAFRRLAHDETEVELLVTVTPELVEAVDAHQFPPGGPGLETQSPSDRELFLKGLLEVPACGPGGAPCGADVIVPAEPIGPPMAPVPAPEQQAMRRPDSTSVRRPAAMPAPMRATSKVAAPASIEPGPKARRVPGLQGPYGYDLGS